MAVTIDEVTAEVAPREADREARSSAEPQRPSPAQEQRRQRELILRMHQRAARVCAN